MKFPTEYEVGEVKGDQTTARQCYMASCRSKNKEALMIEDLREDTKMQRGKPVEELVSIEVYLVKEIKTVWIATDMPRIEPKVITHRLNVHPSKKPVKKKKRTFAPERQEKIEEEVDKLLTVNFIEEIYYPDWIANVVMVPKPGDKWQIYIDYTDLNKACPKDSYPLSRIDLLIDATSVTEVAVNTVLVRKKDGVQKPIYYVSKVLQDVETRYPKIDKIALALIILARHLRPPTTWKGLLSPEASGRLVNWSVELGEFNIQYKPRTAIKVQALADFIVKCTSLEDPPQLVISEVPDPWNLYVDGSSAIGSSGAGIILISPEAHPQFNGQTENMNRSILQGLKKKLDKAKGTWVDELPKVLWAYRTTPHSVTGEAPFLLCYGTEAMLLVEIGIPTIRGLHFNKVNNEVGLRSLDTKTKSKAREHLLKDPLVEDEKPQHFQPPKA
ncbi:hypothetical protein RJ639_020196 [Escallonia herrerae]|uniref:Reverse transcriptase RNase H-like domain-containing protein n=1 Tax=Escallonia herrerae TaxID=1293975 RepID=A0AA89AIJ2_9ASTE|nr:hypothetical protein RJ639_020196 [Escallonia herrerae]